MRSTKSNHWIAGSKLPLAAARPSEGDQAGFAYDSSLEQRGFELAVPPCPARGPMTSELHPGNAQESNGGRTGAALPAAL